MKRIRLTTEGFGLSDEEKSFQSHTPKKEPPPQVHLPEEKSQPQSLRPKEELPGALLKSNAISRKLRGTLKIERGLWLRPHSHERVCISHEYIVSGLFDTFVTAFERTLMRKGSYSSCTEVVNLRARAADVMPDIIGRLLYLRLHRIAAAENVNVDIFESTPTIDPNIELPSPLARAISNIGIFRPGSVIPPATYLPTYSLDPGRAGGFTDRCQSDEYAKLFPEFAKCGIVTSKIESRHCNGTSWYMLRVKKCNDKEKTFEVISNFPLETGNVSATDAITRIYCLQPDHQRISLDSDLYHVREFLYSREEPFGSNLGTVLEDVGPAIDPSSFMQVDMAKVPHKVLKPAGLDLEL